MDKQPVKLPGFLVHLLAIACGLGLVGWIEHESAAMKPSSPRAAARPAATPNAMPGASAAPLPSRRSASR